jgi:hypothetical protein
MTDLFDLAVGGKRGPTANRDQSLVERMQALLTEGKLSSALNLFPELYNPERKLVCTLSKLVVDDSLTTKRTAPFHQAMLHTGTAPPNSDQLFSNHWQSKALHAAQVRVEEHLDHKPDTSLFLLGHHAWLSYQGMYSEYIRSECAAQVIDNFLIENEDLNAIAVQTAMEDYWPSWIEFAYKHHINLAKKSFTPSPEHYRPVFYQMAHRLLFGSRSQASVFLRHQMTTAKPTP